MIKVATWNVCLGLQNKKDIVYEILQHETIDICMIQEVEIKKDYPVSLLSNKDFKIEQENLTYIIYGIISAHHDPSNHWIY